MMLRLQDIPAIGWPMATGHFAGLTTTAEGKHCAVVLLDAKPDRLLPWRQATEWAASVGGELPTRPVSALLFMHLRSHFEIAGGRWYWASEQSSGRTAWSQNFNYGLQSLTGKSAELRARAVRLIPVGIGQ